MSLRSVIWSSFAGRGHRSPAIDEAGDPSQLPDAATTPRDGFRPDVEGHRGVAVLAVVLYHAGLAGAVGGFVGVDVFFVISVFLITGLLVRERELTGTIALFEFFAVLAQRMAPT